MALDAITALLGSSSFKIVDFLSGPVNLSGLKVLDVRIKFEGKVFKNQREDGSFIVDGKMLMPTTIDVSVLIQTVDAAEQVNRILKDRKSLYTIYSRGLIINNLLCVNNQVSMNPEILSSSPFRLSFKEVPLQQEDQPETRQDADSTTIDKGIAYLKEVGTDAVEFAQNTYDKVKSSISGIF